MSIRCVFSKCEGLSRALCYVCHQSLCREHFDKHDHSFNSLLNSLNDKVEDFSHRLDHLNNEELIENCYEKLDQWRDQSYQTIDRLYQTKSRQLKEDFHQNICREQEKVDQLHSRINELLHEEDISSSKINLFKFDMENVEEDINKLEETRFDIEVHPLIVEKNFITIEQRNSTDLNLKEILNPYKRIDCSNKLSKSLASNDQYLLIYQKKCLCLINKELILVNSIPWKYGRIWDMTWSSTLNTFLILAHYQIYLFDQNSMLIQSIQTIPRRNWWSCTCSNRFLFLSTYEHSSKILQFNLQPSIQLIQEWTSPLTCQKDEFIKDIVYQNETLALTIYNQKSLTKRLELRSSTNLDNLWSIILDIPGQSSNTLRSCSINQNQWLVADFDNQRLFHITNKGKVQTIYNYKSYPWYINLFSTNILVISTENSVNFHQL